MAETSGRRNNQKMKPYLVYRYLLHSSDENHVVSAIDIVAKLQEYGIDAERRSIYKDIEEINKAIWIMENDGTIEEVEELIEEGYFDAEKAIVYDSHQKGFYVQPREYDVTDIRLIAECIYSSKYITQSEAERLVGFVKTEYISDYQAEDIRTDALVTNRTRTLNKSTLGNVSTIYDAMSKKIDGDPHKPEKISFKYLKYSIDDMTQQIERRKGSTYKVSPYKLIINDGNYYLLAFDDASQEMRTYRVDRMKNLRRTGEAREGEEAFSSIDLKNYTQRVFSMFGGTEERVRIRFSNYLLDTAIERFGRGEGVVYSKTDDYHFTVFADVEISDQFFGWLCGFGKKAKLIAPETVVNQFNDYLGKISSQYE